VDCQIQSYGSEEPFMVETTQSSRIVMKIEFGCAYYSGDHSYDASMEMSV
jgi:hypothetical protein